MKHDKWKEIMLKVETLPSISGAAVKLFELLDDSNFTPDKMEEILRFDPSLTANILKFSNSAYFGFKSKISSIKHALSAIGMKRLKNLVLTSCMEAVLDKSVPGYDLTPGELWKHSIAVSVIAETLAMELDIFEGDDIFTAALIHDIGKLVLGGFVKNEINEIQNTASEHVSFEAAERIVLGTDHAEIGAIILKNWLFPQRIVDAVRWHHDPDASNTENVIIDIVHVADLLSLIIGIGIGTDGLHYGSSEKAIHRLGLSNAVLESVASQTLQNFNNLLDTFEKS